MMGFLFAAFTFLTSLNYAAVGDDCVIQEDCTFGSDFCNFNSDGSSGSCRACSAIDLDPDVLECLFQPAEFLSWKTSAACYASCEFADRGNYDYISSGVGIDIPSSFIPQPLSNIEGSVCTGCCLAGSPFAAACPALLDDTPCRTAFCETGGNKRCLYDISPNGEPCLLESQIQETDFDTGFISNVAVNVLGYCLDGNCIVRPAGSLPVVPECPENQAYTTRSIREFGPCTEQAIVQDFEFQGEVCPTTIDGTNCDHFGVQNQQVNCWASSFIDQTGQFDVRYHDPDEQIDEFDTQGRCIIGEEEGCVISEAGYYNYREMNIIFQMGSNAISDVTFMYIDRQTKKLAPVLKCDDGLSCRGQINCVMSGTEPCNSEYWVCLDTSSTALDPTSNPIEPPTSHGDPIIWTFDNECYDLNKDGLYLASSHERYSHDVKIAVHNDYMREIQVTDKEGNILLSINNLGDVLDNGFPYFFSREIKPCPREEKKQCPFTYEEFKFDAQQFQYTIQVLSHNYLDPALKDGESGIHLDIFPKPYDSFRYFRDGYTGLYFENPLPEQLEYCRGGSDQFLEYSAR